MPTSIVNPDSVVTLRALLEGARNRVFPGINLEPNVPFTLYRDLHPELRDRTALKHWLSARWEVYATVLATPASPAAHALMERAWVHENMVRFIGERLNGFQYLYGYTHNDFEYEWVGDAFEASRYGEARGILHEIAEPLSWGLFILLDSYRWSDAFHDDLHKDRYMPFIGLMVHMTTDMLGAQNFPETFLSK